MCGKAFLDDLQQYVVKPETFPMRGAKKRGLFKKQQNQVRKLGYRKRKVGSKGLEAVPDHVKAAYGSRRAEQKRRCQRALTRARSVSIEPTESDLDARLAWQLRVEDSLAFLNNLNP